MQLFIPLCRRHNGDDHPTTFILVNDTLIAFGVCIATEQIGQDLGGTKNSGFCSMRVNEKSK
jgi:hypothetical protein